MIKFSKKLSFILAFALMFTMLFTAFAMAAELPYVYIGKTAYTMSDIIADYDTFNSAVEIGRAHV